MNDIITNLFSLFIFVTLLIPILFSFFLYMKVNTMERDMRELTQVLLNMNADMNSPFMNIQPLQRQEEMDEPDVEVKGFKN